MNCEPEHIIDAYLAKKQKKVTGIEEKITTVFSELAKEPQNIKRREFRTELEATAEFLYTHMPTIKDPVKVFRSMTDAFRKRGHCIFKKHVQMVFVGLQEQAIKMNMRPIIEKAIKEKGLLYAGQLSILHREKFIIELKNHPDPKTRTDAEMAFRQKVLFRNPKNKSKSTRFPRPRPK
jgi:transcriptional antiterminator